MDKPPHKLQTFPELLARGRENFDNVGQNITGLENSTIQSLFWSQLRYLNYFMYTTYSTNKGDKVLSVEGVLPLNVFKSVETKLLQEGYWYLAVNPLDKAVHGIKILQEDEYDQSVAMYTSFRLVDQEQRNRMYDTWYQICKIEDKMLMVNDSIHIHLLNPRANITDMISDETLEYTSEELFRGPNPLVSLVVEDPVVGRISLYKKLAMFLNNAV